LKCDIGFYKSADNTKCYPCNIGVAECSDAKTVIKCKSNYWL